MLTLTVRPSGYTTRGQLFDGFIAGETIVTRSTTPLLEACRVLRERGVDPATPIVMRHAGSEHDALRSTVGHAAGLKVNDDSVGKPVFQPWFPWWLSDSRYAVPESPPVRETRTPVPTIPDQPSPCPHAVMVSAGVIRFAGCGGMTA